MGFGNSEDEKKAPHLWSFNRAGKGTRTLDPDLGKVVLYQLSYSREDSPIIDKKNGLVKGKERDS